MQEREKLSSRFGFILLSAGCAIGLGNVWRFPYVTGKYGGAGFVIIYLVFLLLLGLPIMAMEFAIGRASRRNIGVGLKTLEKPGTKWHIYGPFAIAGNYLLLMFYTSITGWLLYYFYSAATGAFVGATPDEIGSFFSSLLASPMLQTFWMVLAVAAVFVIVMQGLKNGVEKFTKWMMVCLLILMMVLAINSLCLPGAGEGVAFYLKPSFKHLMEAGLYEGIYAALGQAFFTLSLGIGAMSIFGSYIDKSRTLGGESVRVIALDTFVAVMSGLIIFPACSSFNVEMSAGPSLLFITLPNIFTKMPGGVLWGSLFFLFMAFAALSTLITVSENIVSYWIDCRGMERKKACLINAVAIVFLSLPCILGFNVLSGFQPFGPGTGVLDLEDFFVSSLLLPIGSLLFLVFCTNRYGWGWDNFLKEANTGKGLKYPTRARFYVTWILPAIVLFVMIKGIIDLLF
jgi:Na+-dependent transporters of the SNF family